MKVGKRNESELKSAKIKELIKIRDAHQQVVDNLNKKIRELVYNGEKVSLR